MHLSEILYAVNTWAMGIIVAIGYPGLGVVMFLENIFPPIPSEVVLPLAGWLTLEAGSGISLLGVTLVGVLGSLTGAYFFYGLGRGFDESRLRDLVHKHGKWLMLTEQDLDVAFDWFRKYDEAVVFFGRLVPVVRSLISVPAGLANMHFGRFTFYTVIGTALWTFVLVFAGRTMGEQWRVVSRVIDRYQVVVITIKLLAIGAFFYTRIRRRMQAHPG
jgi:membrane protein DedA with SNARE-associated domain